MGHVNIRYKYPIHRWFVAWLVTFLSMGEKGNKSMHFIMIIHVLQGCRLFLGYNSMICMIAVDGNTLSTCQSYQTQGICLYNDINFCSVCSNNMYVVSRDYIKCIWYTIFYTHNETVIMCVCVVCVWYNCQTPVAGVIRCHPRLVCIMHIDKV